MSLEFILGTAKNDKRAALINHLKAKMKQHPQDNFIWLVPNHIKFDSEVSILNELKQRTEIFATNRVQVFSFSRLAWYFLRDQPVYQQPQLTPTKQVMLLAKIVQELAPNLKLYDGQSQKMGFIAALQQQINDLMENHITPSRLKEMAQNIAAETDLTVKLSDLEQIYTKYQNFVQTHYNDANQLLQLLNQFLKNDAQQANFHYIISDFTQFNMQELELIKTFLTTAKTTEISLNLDRAYNDNEESIFFAKPQQIFQQLRNFARSQNIPVTTEMATDLRVNSDLANLEDFWIEQNTYLDVKNNYHLSDYGSSIQLWHATTIQQEVIAITTYIRQMVATQGKRYQDFLVLVSDLEAYQQLLAPYFKAQDISYFIDQQHSMKDHAFKELVDSLFALVNNNLRYEDVMRVLRTELLIPADWQTPHYRQAVDILENYILTKGIRGAMWQDEANFAIDAQINAQHQEQMQQITSLRELILQLYQAMQKLVEQPETVRVTCQRLYELLEEFLVFDNLKLWEQKAIEADNLELGQQPEQVVNMFCRILDEYVELFGEQTFVAEDFLLILDNGFDSAYYLNIPSVIDAVHISTLEQVQTTDHKITIIMGANDQDLPRKYSNESLLSDDDINDLTPLLADDESLPETQQQVNSFAPYNYNLMFLSGSEKLIFTYASTKDKLETKLSPYVKLIQRYFNIKEQLLDFTSLVSPSEVLQAIGSPLLTTDHLLGVYRFYKDQRQAVPETWQEVHDVLFKSQEASDLYLSRVWQGLSYQNIVHPLRTNITQQLYGDRLTVSISQLETFYRNPYEYFLIYGLGLKPRKEFKLTPANQGTFYHAVLDKVVKTLQDQNLSWSQISADQLQQITHKLVIDLLDQPSYRMLQDDLFMRQKIIQTIQHSVEIVRQQAKSAQFHPSQSEVAFGQVGAIHNIDPLHYQLDNQREVVVRGRIDQIDLLEQEEAAYFVVDYKSSKHDFNFTDFYNGLNLQMLTYLASLSNDPSLLDLTAAPVGGFYFQLHNPTINLEDLKGNLASYTDQLFKKHQYKGLMIDDGKLAAMEPNLAGQASKIFQFNKNHRPTSSNKVVSGDEFEQMLQFNKKLIQQAATAIFDGDLSLQPVKENKQKTGLQNSEYLPIMQFDAMLAENNYRILQSIDKKEFFEKLKGDAKLD